MALINLHCHSDCSDGTLSPLKLVRKIVAADIKYFSLTDHDAVSGWEQIEPALKEAGVHYCYGVEVTTSLHDNLHILGYGVDLKNPQFLAKLGAFRLQRLERLKKIIARLNSLRLDISFEELPLADSHSCGRPHIADILASKGAARTRKQAFEKYIAYGKPAYVPPEGPGVEEAIRTIKMAGGLAVVAHPGVVCNILNIPQWKEMGLDGIEAFYPAHTGNGTREFVSLAKKWELLVTAGTDFHGPGSGRDRMSGFEYSDEVFSGIRKAFVC